MTGLLEDSVTEFCCHPERSEGKSSNLSVVVIPSEAKRKNSNLSVVVIPSVARDLCDGEFHHLFILAITEIPRFARNDGWESSESQRVAFGMTTKTGMKSIVIPSAAKRKSRT